MQALKKDDTLVDDFLIVEGERSVHVMNAPSPATTVCIPIGEYQGIDHQVTYVQAALEYVETLRHWRKTCAEMSC